VSERPTYLARTVPTLGDAYHYTVDGTLIRLLDQPNITLSPGLIRAETSWNGELGLAGYRYHQLDLSRGRVLPVELHFTAIQTPTLEYAMSVRLFDQHGQQIAQEDRDAFARGMSRMSRWSPGEVVGDYIELALPAGLAPGAYRVGILVYSKSASGDFVNYSPSSGDGLYFYLPAVELLLPQ
jgi:hypothetical protein